MNQPVSLTLRWNSSSGATTYQLQVATDSLFVTKIINDSSIVDTSRTAVGLNNNTNYFWHVLAYNSFGKSTFSSTRKFTTIGVSPTSPQLLSPVNNSISQIMPLTFRWNAVQQATGYRLQVATDSLFSVIALDDSTLTDTTRIASSFQPLTKYYWHVNAKNIAGTGPFSTVWSYTTAVAPPSTPLLAVPADNATGQPINIRFTWYRVTGAASYRLQLSQDSTFATLSKDSSLITDTTLQILSLSNSAKYFWRVNASNNGGSSSFSTMRRFTTIAPAPLPPQLAFPANGALNQAIAFTFRWNKSINALSYRIQLAKDSLFTNIVLNDSTVTDTNRVISALSYSTKYFWRVNATGAGGTGAYSLLWQFTTGNIPSVPILSSPLNNAMNQPVSLTLRWNSSSGATTYNIQLSTDSLFATTIISDSTLVDTSRAIASLNNSTTYFWRVRAQNSIGKSSFSSSWKFSTMAAVTPTVNYIYQETALSSPWNDIRSWSVTRNYASTSPVYQGSTSARIVHSPWAALQFSQGTWGSFVSISPTPYQSLDFAVHGGTSGVTLKVSCLNSSGGNIFTPISVTVPANTWQTKSILMSQLANVPFIAINFTASGSTVTFSLDNIGLVYNQGSAPALSKVFNHFNLADLSQDGIIDGKDLSLFAGAWKNKDLSVADIGPAYGSISNLTAQRDGKIDLNDFEVFRLLWTDQQVRVIDALEKTTNDISDPINSTDIQLTALRNVSSVINQTFRLQLPIKDRTQTAEVIFKYDPTVTRIEDIIADSTGGLLWLKNVDNNAGTAITVIASTNVPLIVKELSTGLFHIVLKRLSVTKSDSIYITVRLFDESSDLTLRTAKNFSLNDIYIPEKYSLSQNYPNPFNPSTTIQFTIPIKSNVKIEIFNILGQLVSRLVDKELNAGFGEVIWKANTASGIYFYRLEAMSISDPSKRYTEIKKMVLLK
jgi:hypothetical protein